MPAAKKDETTTNGTRLSGWQLFLYETGRTFGVPTMLLLILFWIFAPPIAKLLDASVEAQKSMTATQKEISKSQESLADSQEDLVKVLAEVSASAAEIVDVERESKNFMTAAIESHRQQLEDHKRQLEALNKIEVEVTKQE